MINNMKKILLVEDDTDLGDSLKQFIEFDEFEVCLCHDGNTGIQKFKEKTFNLCILDIMLPDINGFDVAKIINDLNPEVPFIFLSAKQQKIDRLTGLKLGASDYITKPFEADELLLKIKNIVKFTSNKSSGKHKIGTYIFDFDNLKLTHHNNSETLTEKEAMLLKYFAEHPEKIIKRERLLKTLWGNNDYFLGRSMDVFISRLRKYLNKDESISIKSIRGVGYIFSIDS